jgi:hypothetical protein
VTVTGSNTHYLFGIRHWSVPFASQNGAVWDAGNDISGKTEAEVTQIVNAIRQLETDPVQKEIPAKMLAANETFQFTSVAHAKAVVLQRLKTIEKIKFFNSSEHYKYGSSTDPAKRYRTNANMWQNGPGYGFLFQQVSGNAFDAISQLCDPGIVSWGECFGACTAAVLWGASQAMGKVPFNNLHPGERALNLSELPKLGNPVGKHFKDATDTGVHVPGDRMDMKNGDYEKHVNRYWDKESRKTKKRYLPNNKNYFWSSENCIYIGAQDGANPKYEGLGLADLSPEQLRTELMVKYNRDLAVLIDEGKIPEMTEALANVEIIFVKIRRVKH